MSRGRERVLKLEIGKKCGENDIPCNCDKGSSIPDIKTKKETGSDHAVGFTALVHYRNRKTFRLSRDLGNKERLEDGEEVIYDVKSVSVYYWKDDPDSGDKVPLLVGFVKSSGGYTFFENLGSTDYTKWKPIGGEESRTFYTGSSPQQRLTEKLDEVSCRIHHAVKIDVSERNRMSYCHDRCSPKRIKTIPTKRKIYGSIGYEHASTFRGQTFTVTSIWNSKNKQEVIGIPNFPLLNVSKIIVYFLECNGNSPVAIKIECGLGKDDIWLKNEKGQWKKFDQSADKNVLQSCQGTQGSTNIQEPSVPSEGDSSDSDEESQDDNTGSGDFSGSFDWSLSSLASSIAQGILTGPAQAVHVLAQLSHILGIDVNSSPVPSQLTVDSSGLVTVPNSVDTLPGSQGDTVGVNSGATLTTSADTTVGQAGSPALTAKLQANEGEAIQASASSFPETSGWTPGQTISISVSSVLGKSRGSALKLMGDDFVERTGYNGYPGVYRNGAFIYGDNDALHMNILSRHFLSDIIGFLPNDSLNRVIFFHRDDSYSLADTDPKIKDILKAKGFPDTQVKTLDEILDFKIRKMIISSDVSELSKLRENLGFNAFGLRDNLYEILPLDLNKALGIKQLMEHYGIPPEECAFIGNGDNDIEAMELSSLSFAVGNAPDYVKKHAKWVLEETCDEGAVAKALGLVYGFTIE